MKGRKIRRLLARLVLLQSIILTPIAINYSNNFRGYKAFGGEYLIIPIGIIIAFTINSNYCAQVDEEKTNKECGTNEEKKGKAHSLWQGGEKKISR